ncbi:hypothetical protein [Paenibacillus mendelii]|uniref:DUF3139 domain-containing protein n=1 Tax=Paenibacillus mendelii TaxID=206163 RepID=A0ABV6JFG8_9BACL|nr:hypothetical protein [Paenibacillus mendelii]MCQ6557515.1 hypothetical protein [Paenibacillus mendelii]
MVKYRRTSILLIAFIALVLIANQFTIVQQATARFTSFVYVTFKYNEKDLKYDQIEFSPQFGSYMVRYTDKDHQSYAFEVASKSMPVIVVFDPLDPGA